MGRRDVRSVLAGPGALGVLGLALAAVAGRAVRTLGASAGEVAAVLPGDGVVPDASVVTTRARSMDAPPHEVWPWLVQLGWGRAGWYSLDAVEALIGAARATAADGTTSWRSLWEVVPAHQGLAVGDSVPLADGLGFDVLDLESDRHLVLGLRAGGGAWTFAWCWAAVLTPVGGGTRLVVRTHVAADPWPAALLVRVVLDPGHAVMELVLLRNLARRVERRQSAA
jgi:hypothetical protein